MYRSARASNRTSAHAKAALVRLLYELGDQRPALVRGDSGYGNEGMLSELDARDQRCVLRLRQTVNVQLLVARQFARQDWCRPDDQGCQMVEDWLQLHGWRARRGVDAKQLRLDLTGPSVHDGERLWEYAVQVTVAKVPLQAIGQL